MAIKIVTALLSAAAAASLHAAPAAAQEAPRSKTCSGTLEFGIQKGLTLPNYGLDVVPGEAVGQDRMAVTCEHFSAEAGATTLLSTDGTYGHRGPADEQWLRGGYRNTVRTPAGTFGYQLSAAYWAVDLGQGIGVSRDDYIELTAAVTRPFVRGPWKLTPGIGFVKYIPVAHNNPLYWQKATLRLDGPLPGDATFYVDGESVHNVNSTTAVIHKNVWDIEAGIDKPLGHGWTSTIGVLFTQYGNSDGHFYHHAERDGRITPVRKPGVMPSDDRGVSPFARIAYEF